MPAVACVALMPSDHRVQATAPEVVDLPAAGLAACPLCERCTSGWMCSTATHTLNGRQKCTSPSMRESIFDCHLGFMEAHHAVVPKTHSPILPLTMHPLTDVIECNVMMMILSSMQPNHDMHLGDRRPKPDPQQAALATVLPAPPQHVPEPHSWYPCMAWACQRKIPGRSQPAIAAGASWMVFWVMHYKTKKANQAPLAALADMSAKALAHPPCANHRTPHPQCAAKIWYGVPSSHNSKPPCSAAGWRT